MTRGIAYLTDIAHGCEPDVSTLRQPFVSDGDSDGILGHGVSAALRVGTPPLLHAETRKLVAAHQGT